MQKKKVTVRVILNAPTVSATVQLAWFLGPHQSIDLTSPFSDYLHALGREGAPVTMGVCELVGCSARWTTPSHARLYRYGCTTESANS